MMKKKKNSFDKTIVLYGIMCYEYLLFFFFTKVILTLIFRYLKIFFSFDNELKLFRCNLDHYEIFKYTFSWSQFRFNF